MAKFVAAIFVVFLGLFSLALGVEIGKIAISFWDMSQAERWALIGLAFAGMVLSSLLYEWWRVKK